MKRILAILVMVSMVSSVVFAQTQQNTNQIVDWISRSEGSPSALSTSPEGNSCDSFTGGGDPCFSVDPGSNAGSTPAGEGTLNALTDFTAETDAFFLKGSGEVFTNFQIANTNCPGGASNIYDTFGCKGDTSVDTMWTGCAAVTSGANINDFWCFGEFDDKLAVGFFDGDTLDMSCYATTTEDFTALGGIIAENGGVSADQAFVYWADGTTLEYAIVGADCQTDADQSLATCSVSNENDVAYWDGATNIFVGCDDTAGGGTELVVIDDSGTPGDIVEDYTIDVAGAQDSIFAITELSNGNILVGLDYFNTVDLDYGAFVFTPTDGAAAISPSDMIGINNAAGGTDTGEGLVATSSIVYVFGQFDSTNAGVFAGTSDIVDINPSWSAFPGLESTTSSTDFVLGTTNDDNDLVVCGLGTDPILAEFTSAGTNTYFKTLDITGSSATTCTAIETGSRPNSDGLDIVYVGHGGTGISGNECLIDAYVDGNGVFDFALTAADGSPDTGTGFNFINAIDQDNVQLAGDCSALVVSSSANAGTSGTPEFSATTLLLAILLAGGFVMFVVRRREE